MNSDYAWWIMIDCDSYCEIVKTAAVTHDNWDRNDV